MKASKTHQLIRDAMLERGPMTQQEICDIQDLDLSQPSISRHLADGEFNSLPLPAKLFYPKSPKAPNNVGALIRYTLWSVAKLSIKYDRLARIQGKEQANVQLAADFSDALLRWSNRLNEMSNQ